MVQGLTIGNLDNLATGIEFNGTNLYIFSQNKYLQYVKPVHIEIVERKIQDLDKLIHLKEIKYEQYMKEL